MSTPERLCVAHTYLARNACLIVAAEQCDITSAHAVEDVDACCQDSPGVAHWCDVELADHLAGHHDGIVSHVCRGCVPS